MYTTQGKERVSGLSHGVSEIGSDELWAHSWSSLCRHSKLDCLILIMAVQTPMMEDGRKDVCKKENVLRIFGRTKTAGEICKGPKDFQTGTASNFRKDQTIRYYIIC